MQIPFNRSVKLEGHLAHLARVLDSGDTSGNGVFGKQCEALLERISGKPVRLTTSGSGALEMMPLLLGLGANDEVIVPSYTFSSTANAFALRGCRIRFADSDKFGNIAVSEVKRLLGPRTRAVIAVHYAGASADMDSLLAVCKEAGVALLEDAAQALGADYKGHPLGSLGTLGCYSFHETKNVSAGEGGALICGDASLLPRAEIIREKGTNRSAFFQGLVDKYSWVDVGSSYVLSELNSAYLFPQLEQFSRIQARRREIWDRYHRELASEAAAKGGRALGTPAYNKPNYHLFALVLASAEQRARFISEMRGVGVVCPFHYVPLHSAPLGRQLAGGAPESLPECEHLASCLVRLPIFYNLAEQEQTYVIEQARSVLRRL